MLNLTQEEGQFISQWFHSLLARELTDEQILALQSDTFTPFYELMKEGFADEVAKFQSNLTACTLSSHPRLELAADYAQLFLLDGQSSALPYASAYLEGVELAHNLSAMDDYLKRFKLGINKAQNEPSDHLCVYLEILQVLDEAEQEAFIEQQLLTWLGKMVEEAEKVQTRTQFYQTSLKWLLRWLSL